MTNRPFENILSISDLETTADRLSNYFFTPGAMRFFNSKIDWKLYRVDNERGYFVTSERYQRAPRLWTVRQYEVTRDKEGRDRLSIDQAGDFQAWGSLEGARRRAEELQGYALIDPKSFEIDRDSF